MKNFLAGGFVTELPGGSVLDGQKHDPIDVAIEEATGDCVLFARKNRLLICSKEEIGFEPSRDHVVALGPARAIAPTLAPHTSSAFAVSVSEARMAVFEKEALDKKSFGKEEDTERTFVVVKTIRQCLEDGECCWTTVGVLSMLMHHLLSK